MRILSIETSCDDTSCAVVGDGFRCFSSIVSSQNDIHSVYGGIVPELASRRHLENMEPACSAALAEAGIGIGDLDGICVTAGPGLMGSLLVGLMYAKGLALSTGLPFIAVNHIEGHLFAPFLADDAPSFPFVALVASGGHTALYLVRDLGDYDMLGATRDDAAGEAFDKAAKLLGLGYPGGPAIQRAAGAVTGAIPLPHPLHGDADFSFSGLKTAVANIVRKQGALTGDFIADLAASFQTTVASILVDKALAAVGRTGVRQLAVTGGVAANRVLRDMLAQRSAAAGVRLFVPEPRFCTDNAAMTGVVGHQYLSRGITSPVDSPVRPDWQPGCP